MLFNPLRLKVTDFDSDWKELIEVINNWKDKNLQDFCLNKCEYECCKMEHDNLTEKQIRLIFKLPKKIPLNNLKNRYGENTIQKNRNGRYKTKLCHGISCPSIDKETKKCKIYHDKLKPDYCTNFPFYYSLENNTKLLEIANCPALKFLDYEEILKCAEKNNIWTRVLL